MHKYTHILHRIDRAFSKKTRKHEVEFETANKILSIILMGISLYIISAPLLPEVTFVLSKSQRMHQNSINNGEGRTDDTGGDNNEANTSPKDREDVQKLEALYRDHKKFLFETKAASMATDLQKPVNTGADEKNSATDDDFYLFIPEIGVFGTVFESETSDVLAKGFWHIPTSSTPDQGGNTVIVAHRFMYTSGPNTFYHLNKLQKGEIFLSMYKGKNYVYEVTSLFEVLPDQVDIEADTNEAMMTLYTCTPIWTSTHRLVVQAKLLFVQKNN